MRLVLGLVLILGFLLASYFYLSSPFDPSAPSKTFVVNQGDGISQIATRLEENGYIRNRYVFIFRAYFSSLHQKLQAGSFTISPSFSTNSIIRILTEAKPAEYWLKIIDGQRIAELSVKLPAEYEGYLFPDSYKIPNDYSPDQILEVIKHNFSEKFAQAKSQSTVSLSDREVVTLASLVEREARTLESKKMVSGILQNRLKIGMALQVDASVQYARDTLRKPLEYWRPLASKDLDLNSPFNTYKNPGLPPSPICNPGLNSLIAAFNPTPSDYLFYITGNDNQMHYAKTLDQHNANIAKYLH